MKLRHILYASVYVKGKNQYHQFHDGILEIEDKEEIKELLKNQNIEEVKEEVPAEEESTGDTSEDIQEVEKTDKKKGKQK
ncbi:hypothetical protein [Fusobacterium necrophorum]|uniref:Uncharacterized protein n=2 Tax=Fusobacterium necrophorum TaxID=859 RepID=A0AAN4ATV7_9FUSO|nr:hypothetical protein [Fusobacterium necrophorum]AYV94649.1 hypothetical protein BWX37_03020 [Fusobacterium necrophorum subsp. funduliforme]EJU18844.1 hypothetical protein HMPREF1127_1133 [Fusobacterium necrophorum subsp. funduliforme Fnf 1007]KYL03341.1 hypothetical protein A2J06_09410 [Fusobacterium necrophorum subsp. funduliforme]KYM40865.1 hypothetical protein A2U03_03535 [Fusobacterium necrophorum subsp. funduliforme]KYM50782.1 hypothetical protein A2U04_00095 [Fusobacterium necrophorum